MRGADREASKKKNAPKGVLQVETGLRPSGGPRSALHAIPEAFDR